MSKVRDFILGACEFFAICAANALDWFTTFLMFEWFEDIFDNLFDL